MGAQQPLPSARGSLYVFDLEKARAAADAYAQRRYREGALSAIEGGALARDLIDFLRSEEARPLVFISHEKR